MPPPPAPPRTTLPTHLRTQSLQPTSSLSSTSTSSSAALAQRVSEKRAELASLKELQYLSASVADQMSALEAKLATLADGTEAVATVLANWGRVLGVLGVASSKLGSLNLGGGDGDSEKVDMPNTLVRIPTEHKGVVEAKIDGGSGTAGKSTLLGD